MTAQEPVIVERVFDATVSQMWEAITDNEKLKQWYFKLPEFRAEVGFEFSFMGGSEEDPEFLHLCKVVEVIRQKKLAYSWRYDGLPGNSVVAIELFPEENGTRLRLTHDGLETIAAAGPQFRKENFVEGWTYFINDALKKFIEG